MMMFTSADGEGTGRRLSLGFVLKAGGLALVAIGALWLIALWLGARFPASVAEDAKHSPYGINRDFGYAVRKYRWQTNGFAIEIWAGSALRMSFDVPGFELARVKTQRWLARDRAILLELAYVYHDSLDSPGEVALLYDYERGELLTLTSATAWRVWGPEGAPARFVTQEEFDRKVLDLAK